MHDAFGCDSLSKINPCALPPIFRTIKTDTIARFLFALMSDIDTRVRWKAAHALRRLAKLGCFDIVKATVSQSSRVRDDAFRDPTSPFYFLAAKLWLTISLYRISAETPEALSSCKAQILTSQPHRNCRMSGFGNMRSEPCFNWHPQAQFL